MAEVIRADGLTKHYGSIVGVRDLTFERGNSTSIYFYVYIENVDFLPGIRGFFLSTDPLNFPGNYAAWLLGITSLNFTVQAGTIAWTGNIE